MMDKKINLAALAVNHGLVDLVSAYIVIGAYVFGGIEGRDFFILVLVYGITAFALQPLLGRLVDLSRDPYRYIWLSNLLILSALLLSHSSWLMLAVVVAGLGNALFHVASGTIGLNIEKKKAWPVGVLVGPGALGLFIGGWLAKSQIDASVTLILIMIATIFALRYLPRIEIDYEHKPIKNKRFFWVTMIGLLTIVGMRALIGFSLFYEWKSQIAWAVGLIAAVVIGKMLAGFIADKWGWRKMSLIMVGLSLPLLVMGYDFPALALLGAFCFQITMPVTLTAVARLQPGYPGWAFGLPCFFLIVGAIFTFFAPAGWLEANLNPFIIIQFILIFFVLYLFDILTEEENV